MQTMHLGTNNHGHKLQAITHMNEKTQNLEAQRKNQWCIHDLRTQNNWHWLQVEHTWMKELETYKCKGKINNAFVAHEFKTIDKLIVGNNTSEWRNSKKIKYKEKINDAFVTQGLKPLWW